LIFEGEYKNGLRWCGTGYDNNGNILFELNNNINGIVKEYYEFCYLSFEGEYLDGKRNGKGKEYNDFGNLIVEGEYKNDLRWNGKGYDSFNNIVYELKDGKCLVKEYKYNCELLFESEYLDGKRNGKGKEYRNDKLLFEGEYLNGKRNGKGKEYWNGKLEFEGEYLNGERNGKRKEYNNEGNLRFESEYLHDYKLKGKFYVNKKLEYEGEFLLDKKWNGKGYDENSNIIYELINGSGRVKEYYNSGELKFVGEYLNGKRVK